MVWENVNLPAYKNSHNPSVLGNFNDWRTQNTVVYRTAVNRRPELNPTDNGELARPGRRSGIGVVVSAAAGWTRRSVGSSPPTTIARCRARGRCSAHGLWARALRRRRWHHREDDSPERGALHGGRRDAARVLVARPRGQALGAARASPPQQLANHDSHSLQAVGAAEARVSRSRRRRPTWTAIAPRLTRTVSAVEYRRRVMARRWRPDGRRRPHRAARPARRRRLSAPDGVREHREPAAGPRVGASAASSPCARRSVPAAAG